MKEILILGALPKNKERLEIYEAIIGVCKECTEKVSSPIDTSKFKGSDAERYRRALQKVKDADLIIGEQSLPSTGQGMEIQEAARLNKHVLIFAKSGSEVSGLVKGCPAVRHIIFYDDLDNLKSELSYLFS